MASERRQSGKIFYGWWIILVAGVGLFLCAAPILGYTFGVFFKSLSQEFNWSRAEISLGFSLCFIAMTMTMPLVGRLVDRFGARRVIVPSVLMFGLTLTSFYFLSASLWHFYALYMILGVVGGGTATVPYFRVISHWFDKKRGLALGLVTIGYGLGSFTMPSLSHVLLTAAGWRAAYVIIGLLIVVVTVPLVSLFLKEKPQMMGLLPDDGKAERALAEMQSGQELGMSVSEALRTGTFWLIVSAVFLIAISVMGCIIHLVPLLTDRGVSAQSAAFATSLCGGATLLGRVVAGYLLDRYFASYVAVCFFGGTALGIFLLWGGLAGGLAFVAAFLVGLGSGAESEILAYLVSRYFGLRAFGEIYGYTLASFTLGGVVGPLIMGVAFDTTGSYRLVLGILVVATATAAGLMTRLRPYRVWETQSETVSA